MGHWGASVLEHTWHGFWGKLPLKQYGQRKASRREKANLIAFVPQWHNLNWACVSESTGVFAYLDFHKWKNELKAHEPTENVSLDI